MTTDQVVSHYIRHCRAVAHAETRFYASRRNASEAIRTAALCVLPDGKRHPHQYRIPRFVLEQAEARLQLAGKSLLNAPSFDKLHDAITQEIGAIRGIGALTVYDIAHRLGAFFGKVPQRVYLHAGTRLGAAIFGLHGQSIAPNQLPIAFSRLAAAEIEDCLCIYKAELGRAKRFSASSCSPLKSTNRLRQRSVVC